MRRTVVHATLTTYGAWSWGDRRGYRTRGGRDVVDGDYRRPPVDTEVHQRRRAWTLATRKQEPVRIPPDLRASILDWIVERLQASDGVVVIAIAVAAMHVHLLIELPPRTAVKRLVGHAKRHVWFQLDGRLGRAVWAAGCGVTPIRSRSHLENATAYILRHLDEGAAVWSRDRESPS